MPENTPLDIGAVIRLREAAKRIDDRYLVDLCNIVLGEPGPFVYAYAIMTAAHGGPVARATEYVRAVLEALGHTPAPTRAYREPEDALDDDLYGQGHRTRSAEDALDDA